MLDTEISIRRASVLWDGVSPQSVERYLKELLELKQKLTDFSFLYERTLFGGDLRKALCNSVDEEIKYCEFYQEFTLRKQQDPNLGKWIFKKQEEINADNQDWQKLPGDQWSKTNGRVKAFIQFDTRGLMVKITLSYQNDSTNLEFYHRPYNYKDGFLVSHLRSAASIQAKVQEFQNIADAYLNEHLYPYRQGETELLKSLLQVEDKT